MTYLAFMVCVACFALCAVEGAVRLAIWLRRQVRMLRCRREIARSLRDAHAWDGASERGIR